ERSVLPPQRAFGPEHAGLAFARLEPELDLGPRADPVRPLGLVRPPGPGQRPEPAALGLAVLERPEVGLGFGLAAVESIKPRRTIRLPPSVASVASSLTPSSLNSSVVVLVSGP